ncbi:GntP family permease [Papillibacter cinnamivorans]|uniref:H+/gluconate symporter n=1 Tax=Papillibacter cinnamivorans DSM 12816 TaxID=1122930 RepID=A0A1W2A112_9FIRM|nr:GntP family permease [Papillibacter cinnamivorans]SMC54377.1 H+/gluconate symporter [Papillibacter cinnamivorans DSM 12816]
MLGIIGMILALVLLVFMAMKGYNILLTALVCSIVVALLNGMNIYDALLTNYMTGYVAFFKSYFIMFLVGALFGKLMEVSNAADAIAALVVRKLGAKRALLAIVIACFVLAYGGVSVFVTAFTLYPIAFNLFKEANLPRKFLAGTIAFGSVTFAMTSPGTPQIQNIIPGTTLGTSTMAGATVGFIAAIFMFIVGFIWLQHMVNADVKAGGHFEMDPGEQSKSVEESKLPNVAFAFIPLIATVVFLNAFKFKVEVSILLGIIIGIVLLKGTLNLRELPALFTKGAGGAVTAIANTCAVVGFGAVVKSVPSFQILIDAVTHIPGPALIGAALAVTIICGITGSASGGLGISIPIIGPIYMAMGVIPAQLHRVASIASGALDSMPHNGYVVTLLNICGTSHKDGYMPIFKLTVVLPAAATALAIILFQIFPNLP